MDLRGIGEFLQRNEKIEREGRKGVNKVHTLEILFKNEKVNDVFQHYLIEPH